MIEELISLEQLGGVVIVIAFLLLRQISKSNFTMKQIILGSFFNLDPSAALNPPTKPFIGLFSMYSWLPCYEFIVHSWITLSSTAIVSRSVCCGIHFSAGCFSSGRHTGIFMQFFGFSFDQSAFVLFMDVNLSECLFLACKIIKININNKISKK